MQLTFDKINGNEEGEEQEFVEILLFLLYFHSRLQKIIIITPNDPEDKHDDNNCINQKQCFTEVAVHRNFYPLGIYRCPFMQSWHYLV